MSIREGAEVQLQQQVALNIAGWPQAVRGKLLISINMQAIYISFQFDLIFRNMDCFVYKMKLDSTQSVSTKVKFSTLKEGFQAVNF